MCCLPRNLSMHNPNANHQPTRGYGVSGDNARPCFGCQCEPNQVTKDAIEEARNRNDSR